MHILLIYAYSIDIINLGVLVAKDQLRLSISELAAGWITLHGFRIGLHAHIDDKPCTSMSTVCMLPYVHDHDYCLFD